MIPAKTRYGYGGMIEGQDYLAVLKVLDQVAEVAGVMEDESVVINELVDKVGTAFDTEREVSYSHGYERGYAAGVEDGFRDGYAEAKTEPVDDHPGINVQLQEAREAGYREGFEAARVAENLGKLGELGTVQPGIPLDDFNPEPVPRRRTKKDV